MGIQVETTPMFTGRLLQNFALAFRTKDDIIIEVPRFFYIISEKKERFLIVSGCSSSTMEHMVALQVLTSNRPYSTDWVNNISVGAKQLHANLSALIRVCDAGSKNVD